MAGHGRGPRGMMPGDKPKDFKGTLLRFLSYLGAHKLALAFVLVFAIGSTIFNIVGPKVLSEATTLLFVGAQAKIAGTGGIDFGAIGFVLAVTMGLYVLSSVCSFVQGWLMSGISQRMCYRLRQEIDSKINRMPYGFFERTKIGDTLSRMTNDVDTLGQSLNQGITQLITSLTTVVGVVIMMMLINVPMTLIALLMVPLSLVLVKVVVSRSQRFFREQQKKLGEVNSLVEETFSGHSVVVAFGQEKASIDRFKKVNDRLYEVGWKAQFLSSLMQPIMGFVGNLGYVAVAIVGSVFAVQGIITVGDIQAFIQYVKNFTQPLTQLAQVSNTLQQMAAALERIFAFLDEEEEEPGSSKLALSEVLDSRDTGGREIEFDHVAFGYDPETPVIHDFSASVSEGQTVALVGPTGSGKTTMVKLLMRFYDVADGCIRIGGHDLREFSRADVRSQFGMVLQDAWLFSGTIRENIRYGRLDATDAEVEQAAREAFAHHFITTLPGGYDFVINEDASNISQGQRQLLTIARAILANRRMLILDEATSSVDTRTEERIQGAMDNLMKGRTSFVIAHRLSTIRDADLILVLRGGDVIEQGTHDELLEQKGFYAELYESQFSDQNPLDE